MANSVAGIRFTLEDDYSMEVRADGNDIVFSFEFLGTCGESIREFELTKDQFKKICSFIRDKP